MGKKSKKRAQPLLSDSLYIDEAGLMRYSPEAPAEDREERVSMSVTTGEGFGGGLIPESMRTPEDNLRINLAANLLIDWMLETYAAQHPVNPGSEDNSLPGVL